MTGSSGARRVDTANLLWYHEEILALIQAWSDPKIQKELVGSLRNSRAYGKIAEHLCRVGFCRTAQQCRDKVKKMKHEYRKISKSRLTCTERGNRAIDGRKRFRYFDLIERIMVLHSKCDRDDDDDDDQIRVEEDHQPVVTEAAPILSLGTDIESITCDVTIKIGNLPAAAAPGGTTSTLPDFPSSKEMAVRQVTTKKSSSSTFKSHRTSTLSKMDGESPSKKGRKRRRQDFEESILKYLSETQKNYLDFEKEMHRREVEAEIKRREEERQHETRLLEIMSQITATLLKGMNGPT